MVEIQARGTLNLTQSPLVVIAAWRGVFIEGVLCVSPEDPPPGKKR